jgi:hypothetical protein
MLSVFNVSIIKCILWFEDEYIEQYQLLFGGIHTGYLWISVNNNIFWVSLEALRVNISN